MPTGTQICYYATEGLIYFRRGESNRGRESYEKAIQLARGPKLTKYRARAAINLAREELLAETDREGAVILEAIEYRRTVADDELRHVLRRLNDIILQRAGGLRNIDTIVDEVSKLIKPMKMPLRVKEDATPTRVPLM